jgi:hypothetical protein
MRPFLKHAGLSLLGGIAIQAILYLVSVIIGSQVLVLAFSIIGWIIVYAGRSTDPAWGLPVMVLINAVVYAVPIYAFWRALKSYEV